MCVCVCVYGYYMIVMHVVSRAHKQRQQMDRRRFEAAHLKYACLQVVARYPEKISLSSVKFDGDATETLNEITPILFDCFEAKYAGL